MREEFNEKNLSTQQSQTEEDAWVFGEDEYQRRSKGFKTEENEREEKVDRLSERKIQVYKKGENHISPGFQKGDEIREKASVQESHPFHPAE